MIGRTNAGGGRYSVLTVTTEEETLQSASVTVTGEKDGKVETKTKQFVNGSVTFRLKLLTEYTITCGEATAEVDVTAYADYTASISLWDGTLYGAGDQYESITGGWVGGHADSRYQSGTQTLSFNTDGTVSWGNGNNGSWGMKTVNTIDMSKYNYLYCWCSGNMALHIADNFPAAGGVMIKTTKGNATNQILKLDISDVSGGKVCVSNNGGSTVRVSKIMLSNEVL